MPHVTCSCIFHAYVLSFQYTCFICIAWDFFDCLSFSPSLSVYDSSMAPKRKSTLAQNPLHSGAFSSFDSAPLSLQFCDDDAHKKFSENFSRRGVHSERHVILADFVNIDLPTVIHNREWESPCDVPITCLLVLIQDFYSNMHGIDRSVPLFFTSIRGMCILVTPQLVTDVLRVPRIEFPNYPSCERLWTMSKDELVAAFCKHPSN